MIKDHPNLGICIDTAHLALGAPYGFNPLTGKGYQEEQFQGVLDRLAAVPIDKIFYVELADVITPDPSKPLGQGSEFDEWQKVNPAPRGPAFVWAFCGRPVPLVGRNAGRSVENDRHLGGARVLDVLAKLFANGYRGESSLRCSRHDRMGSDGTGPLMYEPFEAIHMADPSGDIPSVYANACSTSVRKIKEAFAQ